MALIGAPWPAPAFPPDEVDLGDLVSRPTLPGGAPSGRVVLRGSPGYDDARAGAGEAWPAGIAECRSEDDVRSCLDFARRFQIPVAVRGRGRSFAGYSVNDGLVIDLGGIDAITLSADGSTATVGAGASCGQLDAALDLHGRHVPSGTCPSVGIAGYAQGGGYGITSRSFGMSCDSVVGVRVMLADGRVVEGTPTKNPDLLWAVRGGTGGNFGVVLEITFELHEVGEMWGFCLRWPLGQAAAALAVIDRDHMGGAGATRLGLLPVLATLQDGVRGLVVFGLFHGSRADGIESIRALFDAGPPALVLDEVGRYGVLNGRILQEVLRGPAQGPTLVARSGYVARQLDSAGWQRLVSAYSGTPGDDDIVFVEPYGGQINAPKSDDTAFVHRDVRMNVAAVGFATASRSAPSAVDWCEGVTKATQALTGHVYQNYPVPRLDDYRYAYFGDNFESLLFVKSKYDPHGAFSYEQSIAPLPDRLPPGVKRPQKGSKFTDRRIDDS